MLGCDIIEIERIEKTIKKYGNRFVKRILTPNEIKEYRTRGSRVEFLAGRFAAKEAISKAFGCGIGAELTFNDIEILPDEYGKPNVFLKSKKRTDIAVSISHSRCNVISVCCIKEV